MLDSAYTRSLEVAADLGCRSIAFPAISCGVYGYPWPQAAAMARQAIERLQAGPRALETIELVFMEPELLKVAQEAWA